MTLEPTDHGGVRVLRASGELDVVAVPALLPNVRQMVTGTSGVVLDLTEVTFFDSSGVRFVDRVVRECARAGVACRLVAPDTSAARRVLDLVGMAGTLVVEDLPTALRVARDQP